MTQQLAIRPIPVTAPDVTTPAVRRPQRPGITGQRWVPAAAGPAHVTRAAVRVHGITAQAWSASPSSPVRSEATSGYRAQTWTPAPRRRAARSTPSTSWYSAQTWAPRS